MIIAFDIVKSIQISNDRPMMGSSPLLIDWCEIGMDTVLPYICQNDFIWSNYMIMNNLT